MTSSDDGNEFACENPDELAELHRLWESGQLGRYLAALLAFVEIHRAKILGMAEEARHPGTLLASTKHVIMHSRVVHFCSEMKDQLDAIEKEIWYRGERGEYDRSGIVLDWIAQHAPAWRRWRVKEYLFVVDRCGPDIVARLLV